jgi:hypothetical protein
LYARALSGIQVDGVRDSLYRLCLRIRDDEKLRPAEARVNERLQTFSFRRDCQFHKNPLATWNARRAPTQRQGEKFFYVAHNK